MTTGENNPITPLGMTRGGFIDACRELGLGSGKSGDAYTRFYRVGDADGLPPGTAATVPPVVDQFDEPGDEGVTTKFVLRLDGDGRPLAPARGSSLIPHHDIESVIIPMTGNTGRKTHTLCVSSQVGCAMGCTFCETAQMGLVRSLSPAEIVAQWWVARHRFGADINNIVFMGMGEPLDNLDAVLASIECLTDRTGPGVAMSGITISTVGRVDGLRRLARVYQRPGWKRLGIALSLNAPNDTVRGELMPVGRRWDMCELQQVMLEIVAVRAGRKIMFEYVLIPGVNDAPDHADELADWMTPFVRTDERNHIGLLNVIPYNPRRDSPWPAPDEASVDAFVARLRALGVFAKRRQTKGRSQMAACGQLGSASIRKRRLVNPTVRESSGAHE